MPPPRSNPSLFCESDADIPPGVVGNADFEQAQEALRRAGDGVAQLGVVEPADQVAALVDGVGQLQEGGAVVQVLAAHREDDVAARVRVEEMVEHALHQLRRRFAGDRAGRQGRRRGAQLR